MTESPILQIARHEIRQVLREPKFLVPFLFPPLLLCLSEFLFLSGVDDPYVVRQLMLFCALLISPMGVPLASDSFAGERERGSLELLLLLPVKPAEIFFGKLLAVIPIPFVFILFGESAYALAFGNASFDVWWMSVVAGFAFSVFISGFSLLVSLYVNTARAANQSALVSVFVLLIVSEKFSGYYFAYPYAPLVLIAAVALFFVAASLIALKRFRQM